MNIFYCASIKTLPNLRPLKDYLLGEYVAKNVMYYACEELNQGLCRGSVE